MPSLIRFLAAGESRFLPFRPFLPCNAAIAVSNRLRSASNSSMILSVFTIVFSSSKDSNSAWFLIGSRNNYGYGYRCTGYRVNSNHSRWSCYDVDVRLRPASSWNTLAVPVKKQ